MTIWFLISFSFKNDYFFFLLFFLCLFTLSSLLLESEEDELDDDDDEDDELSDEDDELLLSLSELKINESTIKYRSLKESGNCVKVEKCTSKPHWPK